MTCPHCHEDNPFGAEFCLNCGSKLETSFIKNEIKDIIDTTRAEARYGATKTIVTIFHVLGWIVSIAVIYITYRVYEYTGGAPIIAIILILGAIPSLLLHSSADRLKIVVDTEENTRQAVAYLHQILELLKRNTEG